MRKPIIPERNIAKGVIDGIIFTSSIFMMIRGYRKGTDIFDEMIPSAVEKAHLIGLVASMDKDKKKA